MRLHSPQSAILASVIFNALIIIALIPLALRGVTYRPAPAAVILRRNLFIYGFGGLIVPFVGIKLIDVLLVLTHLGLTARNHHASQTTSARDRDDARALRHHRARSIPASSPASRRCCSRARRTARSSR